MQRTFDNANIFYDEAMKNISRQLASKLKALGVTNEELPELLNSGSIIRLTSEEIDGIILEVYEYNGITLLEVEWTKDGIKQREQIDERYLAREGS